MADRSLEQMDNALDRAEQILAEHSGRLDTMTRAMTEFTHSVEQAFERFEQQHEDHEAILKGHEVRIRMMEDVQRDTREMLRILIERTTGA
jgi:hypothetical protein